LPAPGQKKKLGWILEAGRGETFNLNGSVVLDVLRHDSFVLWWRGGTYSGIMQAPHNCRRDFSRLQKCKHQLGVVGCGYFGSSLLHQRQQIR